MPASVLSVFMCVNLILQNPHKMIIINEKNSVNYNFETR